ncbi:molybdate ABC transporter substrate-binding protein [Psychrobacter okhotskensis]|uniref:molybdate ABC transporter substrate-binding protein n=1 Tax=Psychrobacter TaxID=497 RepID=UPI00191B0708|nr:molybdate ABC transporter substrate-binding protein [Psychrobacter immobilis]
MAKLMAVTPISAFLLVALSACTAENTVDTDSASQTPEQTQTLRIAAAANLSDVLPQIVDGYKADKNLTAQDIDVTYASSGKLYAQIKAGAPYDIFLSANQEFPAKLAAERVVDNDKNNESYTPFTYTQGQLALYSVTKSLHGLEPAAVSDLLIKDANGKIAIANPELAPYGASAQAYLQSQTLYNTLNQQKRLIQAENIGQAFQYAHTGSVDYGFVAQSQIVAIKAKPERFVTLAPESYPAILQDGIVISDVSMATDFSDYLLSKAGQQYFSQAGYLTLQ